MNKKAREICNRIIVNNKFQDLVKKYRKLISIPAEGLNGANKSQYKSATKHRSKEDELLIDHYRYQFSEEAKKVLTKCGKVDKEWNDVLEDLLYYGKTNRLNSVNTTGCNIRMETVEGTENLQMDPAYTGELYISIDLNSSTSDILEFIKKNKGFIKVTQKFLREQTDTKKRPRIKSSTNARRDYMIYKLYKKSMQELEKLKGGTSKYKDLRIKKIMKRYGYTVSSDNVRKIVSKQKERNE